MVQIDKTRCLTNHHQLTKFSDIFLSGKICKGNKSTTLGISRRIPQSVMLLDPLPMIIRRQMQEEASCIAVLLP